jgi:hypothetical protein
MNKLFLSLIIILALVSTISALTIDSVTTDSFTPGKEGDLKIKVENTLNDDVTDVSLSIILPSQFSSVGSSEDSVDQIDQDDKETFIFRLKAANDITPGDYQIKYTLAYTDSNGNDKEKQGTLGITVEGNPILTYSIERTNPVVGQKGRLTFKIVNEGFADAKFVSIKISANGINFLSTEQDYIGTISSDDYETSSFDVIYTKSNPTINALVEYTNFDNVKKTDTVVLPLTIYTEEKAIQLGIIQKNNTIMIISIIVILIVIWVVVRKILKSRRMKKSKLEVK